jgi:hypothetical protein
MNKFSSLEIDFHDSPALLADVGELPEFVKKASFAPQHEIDPSKFAVVLVSGDRAFPKFALNNKGLVWASSRIFSKTAHRLPAAAKHVAAFFIKRACHEYRIECPAEVIQASSALEKIGSNVIDIDAHQEQSALDYDKYRLGWHGELPAELMREKLEEFVTCHCGAVATPEPEQVGEELASKIYAFAMQEGYSLPGVAPMAAAASEALTEIPDGKDEAVSAFKSRLIEIEASEKLKRASKEVAAHNYQESSFGIVTKTASGETLGRFPLHTPEMVKDAVRFFEESGADMAPKYRHELASNIVKNAAGHGVYVDNQAIRGYASESYSGNLCANLEARRAILPDGVQKEAAKALSDLLDYSEKLYPHEFAEALEVFDKKAGLDKHWGRSIKDPYLSTFEATKTAEWSCRLGQDQLSEDQLRKFALKHLDCLNGFVGQNVINALKGDPVAIFDSLPRPEKEIIFAKIQESGV